MPVEPDRIRPVLCHPRALPPSVPEIPMSMVDPPTDLLPCLHGTGLSGLTDYFSSLRTRSMSCSASLIAAARLARVTPALLLPSPKLISHRHPVSSNN